jgi:hypothetical protein
MLKNKSYIIFTDTEKPNHKLVKALHKIGVRSFELTYASHMATDAGWTFNHTDDGGTDVVCFESWLGYTIDSAIKRLEQATVRTQYGKRVLEFNR